LAACTIAPPQLSGSQQIPSSICFHAGVRRPRPRPVPRAFLTPLEYDAEPWPPPMSAWRPPMRRNLWTAFTVSAPPKAPIEFWTLEHERARRSRKHHLVQMDEAAFGEPDSSDIYTASIAPTLLDYRGRAIIASWVFSPGPSTPRRA